VGTDLRRPQSRSRQRISHDRQYDRPSAPAGGERKRGTQNPALGRSRGGLSTKIHLAVDGRGRPVRFILTAGQAHDVTQALALLEGIQPRHVLADKAYGTNAVLDAVEDCGARPIIPPTSRSTRLRDFDPVIYKKRNLIERAINKLKRFRRIATRYDRNPRCLSAMLCLAAVVTFWA
jgi:transposase